MDGVLTKPLFVGQAHPFELGIRARESLCAALVIVLSLGVGMGRSWAQVADPEAASRSRDLDNQPSAGSQLSNPAGPTPQVSNPPPTGAPAPNANPAAPHFFIGEFSVTGGAHLLSSLEIEEAVYPFLGPYRTENDVENARGVLEQAYRDKGFQTVTVHIPPQKVEHGIVRLQVVAETVGRLRVRGSRYYSIEQIKREAPSLAEGTVPNFTQVKQDIIALNQAADRRVTPTLHAGVVPGTVDVDLNVKDTPPLHGSLEINNRYSPDTSALRINGAVEYDNLFQLQHSLGFAFQVAPEDPDQVNVFSAFYLARIPDVPWLTVTLQGSKQDSNVSTLGGIGVAGKGDTLGLRLGFTLPSLKNYYQSLSLGIDYKRYNQIESLAAGAAGTITAPITYYPISAVYSGTWIGKGSSTVFNTSINAGLRGVGSNETAFSNRRFQSSASFVYLRGDLSHTHDLPGDFQFFGKAQGQVSDDPLLDTEEFSAGGLGTVRGYLESEELGDNALLGTLELRTPSLGNWIGKDVDDWRLYFFTDAGILGINDPLPEQQSRFNLASVGAGTRITALKWLNGSLDLGVPLIPGPNTNAYRLLLTFRAWAEF
jgi:hemolysin activation/secretion protein